MVFLFALISAAAANAQGIAVSGQAITTAGYPAASVPVRVCLFTSTGAPCNPTSTIYSDPGLTVPISNPYTTDQYGNYRFFVSNGYYTIQVTPQGGVTYTYLASGTPSNILAGNINGVLFPARCGDASAPTWCSGTTAGDWIAAACATLPANGGTIDLQGLTGTITHSIPCSTPTKLVVMRQDPVSLLTVTESDGGITFPIDNGSSWVGPGGGQCLYKGGLHLGPNASVTSLIGPAHLDGNQENFAVLGACIWGDNSGTEHATRGMVYVYKVFVNTIISNNNISVCPTACLWIEGVGGMMTADNNELNVTSGVYNVFGSPLVIRGVPGTNGCSTGSIHIGGSNMEHANGGASFPMINIYGDDNGSLVCGVYIHDFYIEKNIAGTVSNQGVVVRDCLGCFFENMEGGGGNGIASGDMFNISQSAVGRVANVVMKTLQGQSYTNSVNDTINNVQVTPFNLASSFVAEYDVIPGYQSIGRLPSYTLVPLGSDILNGIGSMSTGSSQFATGWTTYGCVVGQGINCTYSRTNATAPPNYTYSQQVTINSNTDTSGGNNGISATTPVNFTAGQTYIVSWWMRGDGTNKSIPQFTLGNPNIASAQYCYYQDPHPVNTAWTLYTATCIPPITGSSLLAVSGFSYPNFQTGSLYFSGVTFAPLTQFAPGQLLQSVGPYGVATVTNGVAQSLNGVVNPNLFAGADIGAQINAAFAHCSSLCEVRVPAGNYTYSTDITLPMNSLGQFTLELDDAARLNYTGTGCGINGTINTSGPTVTNLRIRGGQLFGISGAACGIHIFPSNSVTISGMVIMGFASGPGVWLDGANAINIFDNRILNNQVGVLGTNTLCNGSTCSPTLGSGSVYTPNAIWIHENTITGNSNWGVQFREPFTNASTGALNDIIENNDLELNGSFSSAVGAVSVGRSTSLEIKGNYFEGSPRQIVLGFPGSPGAFFGSFGPVVRDNHFTLLNTTQYEIEAQDTTNLVIDGNSTLASSIQNTGACFLNETQAVGTKYGYNNLTLTVAGSTGSLTPLCSNGAGVPRLTSSNSYSALNTNYFPFLTYMNFSIGAGSSDTQAAQFVTAADSCFATAAGTNATNTGVAQSLMAQVYVVPGAAQFTLYHPTGNTGLQYNIWCSGTPN